MKVADGFNPFESDVNCLHPQILLNPKFPELVAVHGNWVEDGYIHEVRFPSTLVHNFPRARFVPSRLGVTVQNIKNFYVIDKCTGDIFPMYFLVPCGKCLLCTDSKCSNFARRCQYESQLYDCPPVHVTITYDEQHIPFDRSVDKRAVVLWKKRFRRVLEELMYTRRLRMCVAAEYGKKNTRRPHYHILIWNLKPDEVFTYEVLRGLAWRCWYDEFDLSDTPMCDYFRFTFSPITADYIPKGCTKSLRDMGKSSFQAFGYVAKYFYKQDERSVPPGCKPLFHTMSKSKSLGGIGAPFIDIHKDAMRKHIRKEYYYNEVFSGSLQSIVYDRYVINRVFPSRFMSVPFKVRKSLQVLLRTAAVFSDLSGRVNIVYDRLSRLYPILPIAKPNLAFCYRTKIDNCKLLFKMARYRVLTALSYLESYLPRIDVDEVLRLDSLRKLALSRIFSDKTPRNVWSTYLYLSRRHERRRIEFTQL